MPGKLRLIFSTLLIFFLSLSSFAAKPGPYGLWPAYYGSIGLNDRFGIWAEGQYRCYDLTGDLEQLLLRTAITYNPSGNKNVQFAQGYGYVRSEPYLAGTESKRVTEEHRLYQQLILRQRFSPFYLQHRYRIEERFLSNDFRVRFRYFLSGNLCLNKRELSKGAIFLSAYNEIFLHSNKPVFDRNRLYAGLGCVLSKSVRMEAGHMWQMQESNTRQQVQLILWHNFEI